MKETNSRRSLMEHLLLSLTSSNLLKELTRPSLEVYPDYKQMSKSAALKIAALIRRNNARGVPTVLGLATGSTPLGVYKELGRMYEEEGLDFSTVITFNLDEYRGLRPTNPQSYHYFMDQHLFNRVNIEEGNVHFLNGMARDVEKECERYEELIKGVGGIDLQILGIGRDGHIAFDEPVIPVDSQFISILKKGSPAALGKVREFNGFALNVPEDEYVEAVEVLHKSRTQQRERIEQELSKLRKPGVVKLARKIRRQSLVIYVQGLERVSEKRRRQFGRLGAELRDKKEILNSVTRRVDLAFPTIRDNSRFYDDLSEMVVEALTMGIRTVLDSKGILLLGSGRRKARAIYKSLKEPVSPTVAASVLQNHPHSAFMVDEEAASLLPRERTETPGWKAKSTALRAYSMIFRPQIYATLYMGGARYLKRLSESMERGSIFEASQSARRAIKRVLSPIGFYASTENIDNYRRVFARDSFWIGIAALLSRDEELVEGFRKSLETLTEYQRKDGAIPSNVTSKGKVSYGKSPRIDATILYIIGCMEYAKKTHDEEFLESHLGALREAIGYLEDRWEVEGTDLLWIPRGGDWADEYIQKGFVLYDQVLWYLALREFAEISDQPEYYRGKAETVRKTIRQEFWVKNGRNSEEEIYRRVEKEFGQVGYFVHFFDAPGSRDTPRKANVSFADVSFQHPHGIFDAFGNALAILTDIATLRQTEDIVEFLGRLSANNKYSLIPAHYPIVSEEFLRQRRLWRYHFKNFAGHYSNGGLYPCYSGVYVAALAKAGYGKEARKLLEGIARANSAGKDGKNLYEYHSNAKGKDNLPCGVPGLGMSAAALIIAYETLVNRKRLIAERSILERMRQRIRLFRK